MTEAGVNQYIVIKLDQEQYGIDIMNIENIIVMQTITRVPKSQTYFKGVINLRGDIIPVMCIRSKLGKDAIPFKAATRIIIVKPEAQAAPVGIIVDEVKEVISLKDVDIEKLNYDETSSKPNFSIGVGKHNNDLINILNIPSFVKEKKLKKK